MKILFLFCISILGSGITVSSQIVISGPMCVTPGIVYQYEVTGEWTQGAKMKICVNGGQVLLPEENCQDINPKRFVKVMWDFGVSGKISVTSSGASETLQVMITSELKAGSIDSLKERQLVPYNSIPGNIICSSGEGGNCSPQYIYQWQESDDNVTWIDLPSKSNMNLEFSSPFIEPKFFRRRVTEVQSGSIAYTKSASVFVEPPASENN